MLNKILIFWGLAVFAILLIENMVNSSSIAYILWFTSKVFILVIISTITWFVIWYWFKWIMSKDSTNYDNLDF